MAAQIEPEYQSKVNNYGLQSLDSRDREESTEFVEWNTTVPKTSIEAQAAKKSAVQRGYFVDEFIKYFIKGDFKNEYHSNLRRTYWMRIYSIRSLTRQFLSKANDETDSVKRQIISFGCGLDTAAFNLIKDKSKYTDFSYFEFDLQEIAERKAKAISRTPAIQRLLSGASPRKSSSILVHSDHYSLASCDLTNLGSLEKNFKDMGVDFSKPTLILTEFVLPYIESESVIALMTYLAHIFKSLVMVDHAITDLNSEGGIELLKYFQERNVDFKATDFYSTPQTMRDFYEQHGFNFDLRFWGEVFWTCIDAKDRKRILSIDTFEEDETVMKHYFISLAKKCQNKNIRAVSLTNCRIIDRLSLEHFKE